MGSATTEQASDSVLVLRHMREYGHISVFDAIHIGITELPRKIGTLRRQGHRIRTENVPSPIGGRSFARYFLE